MKRHHRILSFFFDGVPDPNQPPPAAAGPEVATPSAREFRVPRVQVSLHPPVRDGLCHECHVRNREQLEDWVSAVPTLRAGKTELCARCHEAPRGPYTHGPAVNRQCQICHRPHRSVHPHLLRVEQPRELCAQCHDARTFHTRAEHEDRAHLDCVVCHDPHRAERHYLLRSEEEIARRSTVPPEEDQERETDVPSGG